MTHIGIDLAWNVNARTGLAVVDEAGALMASATVKTDQEIDEWILSIGPDVDVVAVDAPLIVRNASGQRSCERQVTSVYGRFDAGCHASNTSKTYMNPPRAALLAERHGWNVDPATPGPGVCVEVYPHPAMIGLFGLGRILPYKSKSHRSLDTRRSATQELMGHLAAVDVLDLPRNARWLDIAEALSSSTRPMHLDAIEDELDAVLCAHLAWLWRNHPGALQVYGSVDDGYILAPPPPRHVPTPRAPSSRHMPATTSDPSQVSFRVLGSPATFATASEAAWRKAVQAAAQQAMVGRELPLGRLSVTIDFYTTPRSSGHPGWDLDNLIKPTIDALTPVIGSRPGKWRTLQADDERIDEIIARKRSIAGREDAGATITVSQVQSS